MREINWNESYSVGVKKLDVQHQIVINQLNKVFELFETNSQTDNLKIVLTELENYAKVHFQTEEELFKKYRYHALEAHNQEHRLYEHKIEGFIQRFDTSGDDVKVEVLEFLADWWMGHIQGADKEYTRFFNNCGVY